MRPGNHPAFFQAPAPEGRSRESSIRLDGEGNFWHDGRRVEHPGVAGGLHSWIGRHPDNGRYILSNGYDWTYFTVDDAPFVVRALREEPNRVVLLLSDGTEEGWTPEATRFGEDGALYATVKPGLRGGPFEAKFSRHAQTSLGPLLVEAGVGEDPAEPPDSPRVRIGGEVHAIGAKNTRFG